MVKIPRTTSEAPLTPAASPAKVKKVSKYDLDIDVASQVVRGDTIQQGKVPLRHFKLMGPSGHGKTQLLLSELKYMKALGFTPEEVVMCIIDCDTQGQEWQIHDKKLVDPDYARCIYKYTARNYVGVMAILQHFQDNVIAQYRADFPDKPECRYIGLEDEAKFWLYVRNFYAKMSRGEGVDTELDLMLKARRIQAKTGKFAPTYAEGRREAFGSINGLFHQFFDELKLGAGELGYNAFLTAKMVHKTLDWGKPTEREVLRAEGRPEITNGYFDFVFRLEMSSEDVWDKKLKQQAVTNRFAIVVDSSGKTRRGRGFRIRNKGAQYLWEYVMSLEREQDGQES
jgi:hypothetical protein